MDYSEALSKEGWEHHYNLAILDPLIRSVQDGDVSPWSKELLNLTKEGDSCLEIGCGSGASSLYLAKHGRFVTALDYSHEITEMVKTASKKLGLENFDVVCHDATRELPFPERYFDVVYQGGLLEHFETVKQIELLKNWKRYGRKMVSMIPNSSSVAYHCGKKIMEEKGTWEYGMEIPKNSLWKEFTEAGIAVEREYTIGMRWALSFLPKRHYLRKALDKAIREGLIDEHMGQGYILVTVGACL